MRQSKLAMLRDILNSTNPITAWYNQHSLGFSGTLRLRAIAPEMSLIVFMMTSNAHIRCLLAKSDLDQKRHWTAPIPTPTRRCSLLADIFILTASSQGVAASTRTIVRSVILNKTSLLLRHSGLTITPCKAVPEASLIIVWRVYPHSMWTMV
jgi:hypothetical protein